MANPVVSKEAPLLTKLMARYTGFRDLEVNPATLMSEVIGVFAFVLLGTGAAVIANEPEIYPPEASRIGKEAVIGFAFGIGILVMIYATAHNGAGHLNPAVTIGLIASGVCPLLQGMANIAAQVLGALSASGILKAMLPDSIRSSSTLGANALPDDQTPGRAFLAEMVATFIAMFVILETVAHPKTKTGNLAPLAIGLTFGILLTVLSPISSGSFNPARTLGPAAVTGISDDLWIWIIGPIVGALIAVPFHLFSSARIKEETLVAGKVLSDSESGSPRVSADQLVATRDVNRADGAV